MKHKDRVKQLKKVKPKDDPNEVERLYSRVASLEDDQKVIVRTLGDLQDRLETPEAEQPDWVPPTVAIEPSNIAGSPYLYLTIYLTSALAEGPHIIVSDAKEFQDKKGICVGRCEHYEEHEHVPVVVNSAQEMIVKIQEYIG